MGRKQKTEAEKYGLIEDLPFPAVSAHADRKAVQDLAEHYAAMILEKQPECVMCQGEFCLSYHVIERLEESRGYGLLPACSERVGGELYGKTGTEKKRASFSLSSSGNTKGFCLKAAK